VLILKELLETKKSVKAGGLAVDTILLVQMNLPTA